MRNRSIRRHSRLVSVTALLASALIIAPAAAEAHTNDSSKPGVSGHQNGHLSPRSHFRMKPDGSSGRWSSGEAIPNIDSVKDTVRTYYGDDGDNKADTQSSPYATEMKKIVRRQMRTLKTRYRAAVHNGDKPSLVFDADDTTLLTYEMEAGEMHFHFDSKVQDQWVQDKKFSATPGMVDLVNRAAKMGYKIIGITGRDDDQKDATLKNLKKLGYHGFSKKHFYTKWTGKRDSQQPDYIHCAKKKCSTVEFKAQTRKHIEHQGYRIVGNWGDQWSDLKGRHADHAVKLPNPMYYLPSPNLPGVHQPWMAPRRSFWMAPDGSSGRRPDGDGIPNIDSVKDTVRAYYGDDGDGTAARHSSRYIHEMSRTVHRKLPRMINQCRRGNRFGSKPAVVLDADDTTLQTYDMEAKAMNFHFDPKLQDKWVQDQRFAATPAMTQLVNRVHAAGCQIIGLTGRNDDQKQATVDNLKKVGYHGFSKKHFYTKWTGDGDSQQPGYIHCAKKECSTIEFKSQTRKHIQSASGGGYDIVANIGDQYSDLKGGHADWNIKLPNPTYYLP